MNARLFRSPWAPYFVLLISLVLTVVASVYVGQAAVSNNWLRFENQVQQTQDRIVAQLGIYDALLRGVGGLLAVDDTLDQASFRTYVERLKIRQRYPGIQGLGYTVRVAPSQQDSLVERMRREGLTDFRIWPEGRRDEYHSIIWLEPLDRRNRVAIGYDMFSEPTRRTAMIRARDSGEVSITGKVVLVQEIDPEQQAGFLLYLPIYRGGQMPPTVEQRRADLLGFAYSPFRADDLFDGIFQAQANPQVAFAIYDSLEVLPTNLLYDSNHGRPDADAPALSVVRTLDFGGRTWSIRFSARSAFDDSARTYAAPLVVLVGLIVSTLLFIIMRAQVVARLAVEQHVAEMRRADAERARLLEREQQARALAEQAVQARDLFLSIASHELKTPLTSLLGYTTLLQRRDTREQMLRERDRRALEVIVSQATRLNHLVTLLLDLSRIETGQLTLDSLPLDLGGLASRIAAEVRPILDRHRLMLQVPPTPLVIVGDELRLEQVFQNLLQNAIKYSPEGGMIRLTVELCGSTACVIVSDQGIGIPEAAQSRLFQRFYRADNADPHQFSGIGVGLYVVKEIVTRHGGSISVSSVEGQGSTFTVCLPLAP